MRRYLPVLVLFVLSPLIAEVLFGATPLSNFQALVVTAPLYGGGAVLIRELARRRGTGWGRIALLGAAYAIVEEGLAILSIFNPNSFNASLIGGRAFGVNWLWSEWTIGYHIIWSIALPILLTELLFPARRTEPWLGRIGMISFGVLYVFGAFGLAAIFRFAVAPGFQAPLGLFIGAVLVVILLVVLALGWPKSATDRISSTPSDQVPAPWVVGLIAFVTAAAWFALLDLPHPLRVGALVLLPMLFDLLLVTGVVTLVRRWSAPGGQWHDVHRLALAFGALPISLLWGFFFVTAGNRVDHLFQGSASLIALLVLAYFGWRLQQQRQTVAVLSR